MCLTYRGPQTSEEFLMHHFFSWRKDPGLLERLWVIWREQLRMAMNTLAGTRAVSHTNTHTHTHTHTHPDSQSCMCTCLHMYACMVSPPIVRQVYLFFFTPSIYLKIIALFFFISFLCQGAFTPVCWLVGQLVIFVYLFIIHFCLFLREQLINGYTWTYFCLLAGLSAGLHKKSTEQISMKTGSGIGVSPK